MIWNPNIGYSVSGAGDINGDGLDDLIIGAPYADLYAGESYVVFGSNSGFSQSLDLSSLDGSNGFVIIGGINAGDISGTSVSDAGDINGDGVDDLIIGVPSANFISRTFVREKYVVFGVRDNVAPVAVDDNVITDEDNALSGSVFVDNGNGTDSDPDGDTLTVSEINGTAADVNNQVTLASGALLTLNTDGTFDYNPNGQFESLKDGETGSDSFTYTINDGNGATDTATVSVTINGVDEQQPVNTINGTTNDDNLVGTPQNEEIFGNNGNDTIKGRQGNDTIEGGRGGDIIRGGAGELTALMILTVLPANSVAITVMILSSAVEKTTSLVAVTIMICSSVNGVMI